MKKMFIFGILVVVTVLSAGCVWPRWFGRGYNSTDGVETAKQPTVYVLKAASSTLDWKLEKVHGFSGEGQFKLASGSFTVDETGVTAGSLALDTPALVKNGGNTLAADHFKFDKYLVAAKYFSATFTIDEIHSVDVRAQTPTEYEVTGTIAAALWSKQVTLPITFVRIGNQLIGDAVISTDARVQAGRTELPNEVKQWLDKGKAIIKIHLVAEPK